MIIKDDAGVMCRGGGRARNRCQAHRVTRPGSSKEVVMGAFFRLLAAGPLFFVSAWILMIFAGIVDTDVGIRPFGYVTSMVVTIGLWLTLAPAIGAVGRPPGKARPQKGLQPERDRWEAPPGEPR
jgi:hypothetical protein